MTAERLQRHPLSAEYGDITGPAWDEFVEFLKKRGVRRNRKVIIHEGQVLDGWQLYNGCLEAGIAPPLEEYDDDLDVREFVDMTNFRRHETEEMQRARRVNRRQRIVEQRAAGESLRSIAAANGVSVSQVQKDLAQAEADEGVHQGTPERNGQRVHQSTPAETEVVKGRDGKTYPKKKTPKAKVSTKGETLKDAFGNEVPARCRDAYADPWLQEMYDHLCLMAENFRKGRFADGMKKRKRFYRHIEGESVIHGLGMIDTTLDKLIDHIKNRRPAGVCRECSGEGCAACDMGGLVPRDVYKNQKAK
jgi:hypothetical protein